MRLTFVGLVFYPLSGYVPAMTIANVAITTASNLRAELARQGRKKGDLARHLGLSGSAMTRRLSGETPMDVNEICAVAAWLDVPISALLPDPGRIVTTDQYLRDSPDFLAVA